MSKYTVLKVAPLSLLKKLNHNESKVQSYYYDGIRFKYFPQKAATYSNSYKCIACGVQATEVRIEKMKGCYNKIYGKPHLNVYAVLNQYEVMMTVDHNQLRSKGGSDLSSNFNTMCQKCNTLRGSKYETVDDFLEAVKGRDLLMEHMQRFFAPKPEKNKERQTRNQEQQLWWESGHHWHYREYLRFLKKKAKEEKNIQNN